MSMFRILLKKKIIIPLLIVLFVFSLYQLEAYRDKIYYKKHQAKLAEERTKYYPMAEEYFLKIKKEMSYTDVVKIFDRKEDFVKEENGLTNKIWCLDGHFEIQVYFDSNNTQKQTRLTQYMYVKGSLN